MRSRPRRAHRNDRRGSRLSHFPPHFHAATKSGGGQCTRGTSSQATPWTSTRRLHAHEPKGNKFEAKRGEDDGNRPPRPHTHTPWHRPTPPLLHIALLFNIAFFVFVLNRIEQSHGSFRPMQASYHPSQCRKRRRGKGGSWGGGGEMKLGLDKKEETQDASSIRIIHKVGARHTLR